jgi:Transposase DDE domain
MRTKPSLSQIVTAVQQLYLPSRKRANQGCKPIFMDSFIIGLAVYQHIAGFKYANAMLDSLEKQGLDVPAPSTYSERKKRLLGSIILAVKSLADFGEKPVRVHMDSKQLATSEYARAKRVKLPGAIGWDAINECYFYGLRLHATVDDEGWLRRVILRKANEHDVTVAPHLLTGLTYTVATGDKGYISQTLKERFAPFAVDIIAKRRRNQNPAPSP